MKFGIRLREIRKAKGLGIKTLGKRTKVNFAYLSRIESGQVQPSEQVIRKLANVLGHDEAELMLLADRIPPAWRPTIHKSPSDTTMLIREFLEDYEAGTTTVDLADPIESTQEQTQLKEDVVIYYTRWANEVLNRLEKEMNSGQVRAAFAAWSETVRQFAVPDEQQFRLHVVLTNVAFKMLENLSKNNAASISDKLWPKTWKHLNMLNSPRTTAELDNAGKTWHPELFQRLYTSLNLQENIREFGKVYTPTEIASYILDELSYVGKNTLISKLLDPAVGCGIFLTEAARRICKASPNASQAGEVVLSRLVGLDNDLTAVCLSKLALAILLTKEGCCLPRHADFMVFLADTLDYDREATLFPTAGEEVSDIKLMRGTFATGFNLVVGNPPYGKIPSSDSRVQYFKDTVYGHANMYGMFLQFALEHLGPFGKLGFIVPKSFSSGLYFKRLREFMLYRIHLDEMLTFHSRKDVFRHSNILQETVILLGSRNSRNRTVLLKEATDLHDLRRPTSIVRAKPEEVDLGAEFDHILCTSASRVALGILDKVRKNSKPLEAFGLRASTGKFVWNRFKKYLHHNPNSNRLPLYWMHNLKPFRFLPNARNGGKALFVDLNEETRSWLNPPKELVLIKRISAKEQKRRIEACYVPGSWQARTEGYFLENHLNFIFKRSPDCRYDLTCLAAILNSKLLDFVFRLFNGNTQVSATELNIMPLPGNSPKNITDLAYKIVHAPAGASSDDLADLENKLNREVYNLFNLDENEYDFIEAYLKKYGR